MSLTDTDLREAVDSAKKIGDDYLQKQAKGYAWLATLLFS